MKYLKEKSPSYSPETLSFFFLMTEEYLGHNYKFAKKLITIMK